jgi:molecular chaperone GrpE
VTVDPQHEGVTRGTGAADDAGLLDDAGAPDPVALGEVSPFVTGVDGDAGQIAKHGRAARGTDGDGPVSDPVTTAGTEGEGEVPDPAAAPVESGADELSGLPADVAIDVEDLLDSLEAVTRERDDYLGALQRLQAEFDNFRKRTATHTEARVQAGIARLVEALLPVLDACDAAVSAGETSVEPIARQLLAILGKEGLDRIPTEGEAFDPTVHEAVLREDGEGGDQVVVEEFRPGYLWAGKVLRPASVKVRL